MWFKNLCIYRFTQPFTYTDADLEAALKAVAFQPCDRHQRSSFGWVPPLGEDGKSYVHAANGYWMVCARKQEKILPMAAISERLEQKIKEHEVRAERKLYRKEKEALMEELIVDLLPNALTRSSLLFAYFDSKEGLLVVNTASARQAEELLALLRKSLGRLPVAPLAATKTPRQAMTSWLLQNKEPEGFKFGFECELRDVLVEGNRINFRNEHMQTEEILSLVKAGHSVTRLALSWNRRVECVVDDKLLIRKLHFSDMVHEEAANHHITDAASLFDVNFSIMTGELSAFISALDAAFPDLEQRS